jgi:hypothetical protein
MGVVTDYHEKDGKGSTKTLRCKAQLLGAEIMLSKFNQQWHA